MKIVAVLIVILISARSFADVIVFRNDDNKYQFKNWSNSFGWFNALDITKSASEQPGELSPVTSTMVLTKSLYAETSTEGLWYTLESPWPSGAQIFINRVDAVNFHGPVSVGVPRLYEDGNVVTEDGGELAGYASVHAIQDLQPDYSFVPSFYTIGVRFLINDNVHYGFVTIRTNQVMPIAWGYESEPGVGLVVPFICPVDLAEPYGVVNFFDLSAFLADYDSDSPLWYERYADYAEPYRVMNFFDIAAFWEAFTEGCP